MRSSLVCAAATSFARFEKLIPQRFRQMRNLLFVIAAFATMAQSASSPPKAFVYRGPDACDGCPETVAELLETSAWKFEVTYVGPKEDVELNDETLKGVTVYAQPGGPDLDTAYKRLKKYKAPLQNFVAAGGHYLGFCLGAYLAGYSPGFELLPTGADASDEMDEPDSQVTTDIDTVIQVDWTFVNGTTKKNQWLYFQDGALITGLDEEKMKNEGGKDGRILAHYSKSGHVAASVTPYGKGWVGLVGPHPEATEDWYTENDVKNPDGVSLDIGYDFLAASIKNTLPTNSSTSSSTGAATSSTASSAGSRAHPNPIVQVIDHAAAIFQRKG